MIAQSSRKWGWKLGLVSGLAMSGAIVSFGNCVLAQLNLTPDAAPESNLGTQVEAPTPLVDQIQGGTQSGNNLFHSFSEFNVGEGRSVYFENPDGVTNILSRVTGNDLSDILGTLGVGAPGALGTANLFLINPNGIIFGPNARLDVGGSFVATTANAIQFGNQGFFSASAPDVLPVLTVNPSAFFFNQIANAPIQNNSIAPAGLSPSGINVVGLRVPDSRSLLLVGGDISLESGGKLNALGGRVELGGLAGVGIVGLEINGNTFSLSFTRDSLLSNVTLADDARVGVRGAGGGNIVVNANTFTATNGGRLVAGTEGLGNGGDITVNANNFRISGIGLSGFGSGLYSQVLESASGNAGNIFVNTSSFNASSGAALSANTLGQGNAGSVNINARDTVSFDGGYAYSTVESTAVGNSGGINITSGSLFVIAGAQLDTFTLGRGNAGSVTITARDEVSFEGVGNGVASAVVSTVESGAKGDGGEINITSGSLSLTNGGQLITRVRGASRDGTLAAGQGNAGNININVRDAVTIAEANSNGLTSRVDSRAETGVTGNSGDISLTARSLSVTGGAVLASSAFGRGNGGNVTITARDKVSFDGVSFLGYSSDVDTFAAGVGNGGNIDITAGSLSLTNGAQLGSYIAGEGNAGNVTITARDTVSFDGVGSNELPSGVISGVTETGVGKGSNINIKTGSLSVTNGANLNTDTLGQGNAGSVTITARDTVSFDGINGRFSSGVFSTVQPSAVGNGGDIIITTRFLALTNRAGLIAESVGNGTAGNIEIEVSSIKLDNLARIGADTVGGQGNIILRSQDLVLRRGSNITTNATGSAIGGNITIDTGVLAALEDSDITANAEEAFGGRVIINAQGIFGTQLRLQDTPESDITATSALGPQFSGTVELNTPDVDPSRGLAELPAVPVDTEVAQGCSAGGSQAQSEFIITGRGGLPPNPGEALSTDAVQVDLVTLNPRIENRSIPNISTNPTRSTPVPLVEAQGWIRGANGKVVLTANAPTVTPHHSWQRPPECSALQSNPKL